MPVTSNEELKNSEEMRDIITAVPGWLLRWGISLFFGVLLLMVSFGAIIRYPDIIKTQVKIKMRQPPVKITAPGAGKLLQLRIAENAVVKAGQVLAGFEDVAAPGKINPLTAPISG